ncbi:uncharacterized protein LOC142625263 [Castanea sativa]|uniref:uncharacterized protein LOC142625263 n=1 Tax=Castanea sativa TaxID=21020 RepID=UPI003F64C39F
MKFLELGAYLNSADKRERHSIRMMATQYILCGGKLYRRPYDGVHLHCLKKEEVERVMEEVHQGICGPHMNRRISVLRKKNIICWFGVPQEIISDNGSHFEGEVRKVTEEYGIEHYKSSPYRPHANRAIKAANKNVKNILAKMVVTYKNWTKKLPFTLWGYRTFIHASTRATPYSLVYGSEVVLPIEVEIQSLRVLVETKVLEEDWTRARYEQLALKDEKRARAQYHARRYQKMVARAFNKKVKPRNLKEGDLVLKVLRDETFDPRGKMKPRWSGPFIFKKIMFGDATRITNLDVKEMLRPINMDGLWKYHI